MKPDEVTISDYNIIVEEFKNESDRGAAVLAGSFIENYLAKYLKSKMIKDKKIEKLFQGFGPFSTFSQRYEAAYAFGYISIQQRKILSIIKEIRNHFAHKPTIASFEKPPVSNWCNLIASEDLFPNGLFLPIPRNGKNFKIDSLSMRDVRISRGSFNPYLCYLNNSLCEPSRAKRRTSTFGFL